MGCEVELDDVAVSGTKNVPSPSAHGILTLCYVCVDLLDTAVSRPISGCGLKMYDAAVFGRARPTLSQPIK